MAKAIANIIYENGIPVGTLEGTTAVIGYRTQGQAQADALYHNSSVVVGVRKTDPKTGKMGRSWENALSRRYRENIDLFEVSDAVEMADRVHILTPDPGQGDLFINEIEPYMKEDAIVGFSHGFSHTFKWLKTKRPVYLIAPKSPGSAVWKQYFMGNGVPAVVGWDQDTDGVAKSSALKMGRDMLMAKNGLIPEPFSEETYTDLTGEQFPLCGYTFKALPIAAQMLYDNGCKPFEMTEWARHIKNQFDGGLTAEAEGMSSEARKVFLDIVSSPDYDLKPAVRKQWEYITSGRFADEWKREYERGMPTIKRYREDMSKHVVSTGGNKKGRNVPEEMIGAVMGLHARSAKDVYAVFLENGCNPYGAEFECVIENNLLSPLLTKGGVVGTDENLGMATGVSDTANYGGISQFGKVVPDDFVYETFLKALKGWDKIPQSVTNERLKELKTSVVEVNGAFVRENMFYKKR